MAKSEILIMRITPQEKKALFALAGRGNASDFVRQMIQRETQKAGFQPAEREGSNGTK